MGSENIQVFDDSQLIINQVQGEYQAKDDSMIQNLAVAQRLIKKFKSCKLTQIPREQNSQADALANLGSALETSSQMSIPLRVIQWPATLEEPLSEEVSAVEEGETWMTPLVQYLEAGILPEDRNEARKIKKRATRYCFSQEKLYRRSFSGPYMRAPGQKVLLLIVTDYFSKWVEAEAVSCITDLQTRKFLWTNVITHFGAPHEIVTDNGPQVTSHNFKEFCKDWGTKLTFATPRHPQSNGKAESTNKTMVNMLKKRLEGSHGKWTEELHEVLWAYRTTPKTGTWETPYSLVYDSAAIVPTEMHVRTTVSGPTSQEENNELMALSLDLLDEKREAARLRNWSYQQDVPMTYNKKTWKATKPGTWAITPTPSPSKHVSDFMQK
ncbi:PREDICTED: uncharacterized protein LOC106320045 [Brassica oleracea var. oleracea]|uniref:uncharacterized protein LOC106320045 n=1 Tax=Brassica oleracea var. oleracea TaxID=109376 RepID=UPI0006A6F7B3|nr:PREDICTED: uncharacterized protein LOC106320045 [Brassica oleracea var. oleracea]